MKNLAIIAMLATACNCSAGLENVKGTARTTYHCAEVTARESLSDVKHHVQELVVQAINDATAPGGLAIVVQKVLSVISCIESQGAQCPILRDALTLAEQSAIDGAQHELHGFLGCLTGEAFAALMHGAATTQEARAFANALTWTPDPPKASYAALANAWEDLHFAMYDGESFQTAYGVMK